MAASEDPRALLRAARKERRVTHPHASYTSTGNLLCNLCECPIKSEASWAAHLHSTGHTLRLSREQDAAIARNADVGNGKKRKAGGPADGEGSDGEERKRMKGPDAPTLQNTIVGASAPAPIPAPAPAPKQSAKDAQADLDALEADLAALERESRANAAIASNTISAPALSAEDIAAQAREELSAQRGRRDIEQEEEREEAARALEEEFAEMQTLENRVKKLREKREMLRAGTAELPSQGANLEIQDGGGAEDAAVVDPVVEDAGDGEDDDDDDDDEEFDDWTFGAR
jgi:zinc finger protein 830